MENFEGFGLNPALNISLQKMNYTTPTPIQAQAIPLALEGHDIMGSAQTGTGKTAAFAIPLVERLLSNPKGSALVLTPTRELGKQILDIMHQLLGPHSPIKTAFLIGGDSMEKQLKQLKQHPRLIVGTPGRINDHLERGTLMLNEASFLVLDETDRMLDMGFTIQLERIFKYMPRKRQTLMFSATLPKNILKMSEQYMNDPKRVSVGEVNVIATKIKQEVIRIKQDEKYDELLGQLHERNGSVIVFVKTKYGADRMAKNLRRDGFESDALHGDLRQSKRDRVMKNFRNMNFRVLIATDIAARGLDVPHIEHVINYDLPQVAEDYIHRMGRTARAGAEGAAVSFVSNEDGRKWKAIEILLNPEAANDRKRPGSNNQKRDHDGKKNRHKSDRRSKGRKTSNQDWKLEEGSDKKERNNRRDRSNDNADRNRSEGRQDRNRSEGRQDRNRSEGRQDRNRSEGRQDRNRSEGRQDRNRSEGRQDRNRSEGRQDRNRSEGRQDRNRSEGRQDRNRSEGRQDRNRSEGRQDRNRSEGRPQRGNRTENRQDQNKSGENRFQRRKLKAA